MQSMKMIDQALKANPWAMAFRDELARGEISDDFKIARRIATRERFTFGLYAWRAWARDMAAVRPGRIARDIVKDVWQAMACVDAAAFDGLDSLDFCGFQFPGTADFSEFSFSRDAWFNQASFDGLADFSASRFGGEAYFEGASFSDIADFSQACFTQAAQFRGVQFTGESRFQAARFERDAWFRGSRFNEAHFIGAHCLKDISFGDSIFNGSSSFASVVFEDTSSFDNSVFQGPADFTRTRFNGKVFFTGARFEHDARFGLARFAKGADLHGVYAPNAADDDTLSDMLARDASA